MRFVLRVVSGSDAGATYPVRERLMLGRSQGSDVVLDHEGVGRFHALVERQADGRHTIADLDTASGIRVDGRAVRRAVLEAGNVVEICGIEMRYESVADDASTSSVRSTARSLPRIAGAESAAAQRRIDAVASRNPTNADHGWLALLHDVLELRANRHTLARDGRLASMFAEPPLFSGTPSRRADRRHPCTIPVQLVTARVGIASRGLVLDLGPGGLRVHTLAQLHVGETVRLEVIGGNGQPLGHVLRGRVVWRDAATSHAGLAFVD